MGNETVRAVGRERQSAAQRWAIQSASIHHVAEGSGRKVTAFCIEGWRTVGLQTAMENVDLHQVGTSAAQLPPEAGEPMGYS